MILFLFPALEVIPRQLCDNAGFDATNILNKLRQKHAQGHPWYGVDILNEDIADYYEVNGFLHSLQVEVPVHLAHFESHC